jgi:Mrp family chromosome partitioning ATPase
VTLVTVSTVKGAPGGSTVALLLARAIAARLLGDRACVLAECDLSGGDLAPGLGLPGIPGIASLALVARHGLTIDVLLAHTQSSASSSRLRVLPGIAGPEQGTALGWMLGDLGRALAEPSVVAVADLGRLRGDEDQNDELRSLATANLLVTRDDVASLLHSRAAVESARRAGICLGVILAGERTRQTSHISAALGAEVVGAVRFDPRAVRILRDPRRLSIRRKAKPPHRAHGLISDIEAIASKLSGLDPPVGSPIQQTVCIPPAPHGAGSPAPSTLGGRIRRRAVLVG